MPRAPEPALASEASSNPAAAETLKSARVPHPASSTSSSSSSAAPACAAVATKYSEPYTHQVDGLTCSTCHAEGDPLRPLLLEPYFGHHVGDRVRHYRSGLRGTVVWLSKDKTHIRVSIDSAPIPRGARPASAPHGKGGGGGKAQSFPSADILHFGAKFLPTGSHIDNTRAGVISETIHKEDATRAAPRGPAPPPLDKAGVIAHLPQSARATPRGAPDPLRARRMHGALKVGDRAEAALDVAAAATPRAPAGSQGYVNHSNAVDPITQLPLQFPPRPLPHQQQHAQQTSAGYGPAVAAVTSAVAGAPRYAAATASSARAAQTPRAVTAAGNAARYDGLAGRPTQAQGPGQGHEGQQQVWVKTLVPRELVEARGLKAAKGT